MSRLTAALAGLLAPAVLLTGCTGPGAAPAELPSPAAPSFEEYVALGDSFTAAPFVPTTDLAGGCLRSDGNYPALLADDLDVRRLRDVSCSAAETGDLTGRQQIFGGSSAPPQLRAVTPRTDLVTLGIGGNDFGLFSSLVRTCTRVAGPCLGSLSAGGADLPALTGRIGDRVEGALAQVADRAPDATVVLVGYPRLVPSTGTCPGLLPLSSRDYRFGDRVSRALNDALAQAARRTGALYVDMYAASQGHDICSDDPWVNGRRTDQARALAYHPFADGMRAVADEIASALSPL